MVKLKYFKMNSFKGLFLSSIVVCGIGSSFAQAPEFDDLRMLFGDGKLDKCLVKADKYVMDDDTKKEPVPYLFASKSLFEISKDASWIEKNAEFAKAFKESLNYAAKFKKYDKDGTYSREMENAEFLEALLDAAFEDAINMANENQYSKALATLKKMVAFAPDFAGGWLYKGVCDNRNKVKADAKASWETGLKLLENTVFEDLNDVEKKRLKFAIIEYCTEQAVALKKPEEAKKVINIGYQWYQNDEDYKAAYDKFVN